MLEFNRVQPTLLWIHFCVVTDSISMPVPNPPQRQQEPQHEQPVEGRVLIVDADVAEATRASNALQDAGFEVTVMASGYEALRAFNDPHCSYNVMLVEDQLQDYTCIQLAQAVRMTERESKTKKFRMPVIVFTSQPPKTRDTQKPYMDAGIDGYIAKPFEMPQALLTVKQAIHGDHQEPHPYAKTMTLRGSQAERKTKRKTKKASTKKQKPLPSIGPPSKTGGTSMDLPVSEENDVIEGVVQLDAETSFPYVIMGKDIPGVKVFHMVVVHDIFDTCEVYRIFFQKIVSKYPGLRVLLWNYPGQAFTTWRGDDDLVLNNEYLAGCLEALLAYVGPRNTGEFALQDNEAPFYLMGVGNGGCIASCFASAYLGRHPNMRGLLLLNGFLHVDTELAKVFHDSLNTFATVPPGRPDMPVYFFSRYLFSAPYLAKVGLPLALNLYTAVHNPITLQGRFKLAAGALKHVDLRANFESLGLPIICVASSKDAYVRYEHATTIASARGGEVRSIKNTLTQRRGACVIWIRAGHELLQEARQPVSNLIEQLVTGYHERNDVSFLPLAPDSPPANARGQISNSTKLSQKATQRAQERTREMQSKLGESKSGMNQSQSQSMSQSQNAPYDTDQPQLYEDRYVENVVSTLREARESQADSMQTTSYPVALDEPPPIPADLLAYTNQSKSGQSTGISNKSSSGRSQATKRLTKKDKRKINSSLNLDPESAVFARRDHAMKQEDFGFATEVREPMQWRLKRNKQAFERIQAHVRKIQRCWRSYIARTLVARMRQQRGAVTMQKWWRGCMGRMLAAQKRREHWAAHVIQKYWRGFAGREVAARMAIEGKSAKLIQKCWRGYRARAFVSLLRKARGSASIKIQSLVRQRQAMKRAWRLRDMHNASTNIQRVWRGRLGRARARKERDKYLFSKSQSQSIEFGRQMLMEHKLHGTKLQSEVSTLTHDKIETEEAIQQVNQEINTFHNAVYNFERQMNELSSIETREGSNLDEDAKAQLRVQKNELDRNFSAMLVKIADRKEKLQNLEVRLQKIDATREAKQKELNDLERKLVVLLEEQQRDLKAIKIRQEHKGERLIEDAVSAVQKHLKHGTKLSIGNGEPGNAHSTTDDELVSGESKHGPTAKQRADANALMSSTETMMKFGFMGMSLTYFSSLNMIRAMKQIGTANTMLSNPLMENLKDTEGTSGTFQPSLKPGQTAGQENITPDLWTVADVCDWLRNLQLGQYADAFAEGAVDGFMLTELTDEELKESLGVTHNMHRKKILSAVKRTFSQGGGASSPSKQTQSNLYDPSISVFESASSAGHAPSPVPGGNSIFMSGYDSPSGETSAHPAAAGLKLSTLMSKVKHDAYKVEEAISAFPEAWFDEASYVVYQNVEGVGTQYIEALNAEPFHINKADGYGNTLLISAAQNGQKSLAQTLLSRGANPNHQNATGNTALHYAIAYKHEDLAEVLIQNGASTEIRNNVSNDPYDGIS